jgi:hypothetical protein
MPIRASHKQFQTAELANKEGHAGFEVLTGMLMKGCNSMYSDVSEGQFTSIIMVE